MHYHWVNFRPSAQLLSRYWHITDGQGNTEDIHGPGVIGKTPKLAPGESFEYSSGTPLNKPSGFMFGNYRMINEKNESFFIDVPIFSLDIPSIKKILN